jgi:hypothetical protein
MSPGCAGFNPCPTKVSTDPNPPRCGRACSAQTYAATGSTFRRRYLFAVTPQKDGHAMTVIKWLVRAFPTWKARCVFAHIKPVPRTAASRLPTPS